MKYVILFYGALCFMSCSPKIETSLEPLKIDDIDHIPYLMFQHKIDTVFEVVTFGKINNLSSGDTLNYYIQNSKGLIKQKMNSLWCCYYEYEYNLNGLLRYYSVTTDINETYFYERYRNGDTIFENSIDRNNTSIYLIDKEKVSQHIKFEELDFMYSEITNYRYDERQNLIKSIKSILKSETGEIAVPSQEIKTYTWNQDRLKQTQASLISKTKNDTLYTEVVLFDDIGFPQKTYVIFKGEKLYESVFIRN